MKNKHDLSPAITTFVSKIHIIPFYNNCILIIFSHLYPSSDHSYPFYVILSSNLYIKLDLIISVLPVALTDHFMLSYSFKQSDAFNITRFGFVYPNFSYVNGKKKDHKMVPCGTPDSAASIHDVLSTNTFSLLFFYYSNSFLIFLILKIYMSHY